MKNIKKFEHFEIINEAFKSNILKEMKLDKNTIRLLLSSYDINLSALNDNDFIKIDINQIKKKPYSTDDYLILIAGKYEKTNFKFDYNQPESDKNLKVFKFYGLLYILRGTKIKVVNGKGVYKSGKYTTDNVKKSDIIEKANFNNFDVYAIQIKENEINNIRDKRRDNKSGAFISKNKKDSIKWRNNYYKIKNDKRYAAELKKKLNFDKIFETASKKLETINKANLIAIEFFKYYHKINDTKSINVFKEVESFNKINFDLKPYEEFHVMIQKEYVKSKIDVIMSIVRESSNMIKNSNQYTSDEDLKKLKNAVKLLNDIPEPNTTDAEQFIKNSKWVDSGKLDGLNKKTGIFD